MYTNEQGSDGFSMVYDRNFKEGRILKPRSNRGIGIVP